MDYISDIVSTGEYRRSHYSDEQHYNLIHRILALDVSSAIGSVVDDDTPPMMRIRRVVGVLYNRLYDLVRDIHITALSKDPQGLFDGPMTEVQALSYRHLINSVVAPAIASEGLDDNSSSFVEQCLHWGVGTVISILEDNNFKVVTSIKPGLIEPFIDVKIADYNFSIQYVYPNRKSTRSMEEVLFRKNSAISS